MRTIAQISDLHFGRHSDFLAEDLLTSVNERAPALVVISGDLTQRARHGEFAQARAFLDRVVPPKLVVPGNHDVPLFNLFNRFWRPLARYDRHIQPVGAVGDLYRDDEIAVLGLNTARSFTRKHGRLSVEQIARIGQVFAQVAPHVFKTLVTHHPLGMPEGETERRLAGRSAQALGAIAAADIHLLLSGHYHRAMAGDLPTEIGGRGAVLILHAGTAISTRTRELEGNSYNLIEIDGDVVTVRVMCWGAGRGFHEVRAAAYRFVDGRWRTAVAA
jgi:3',5'-cyclic AMP phosphodiesterase CpdA